MKKLPCIQTDFSAWYHEVIMRSQLIDQSPTRGTIVIRPYGYALWENIQRIIDQKLKNLEVHNLYLPLFIPESFINRETEHIEGFSPELAVVTHAGGKKLSEPLVVRPTSETIMYHMFARWITSWRDLPLKVNQWANVVRWEMRPRAFLRTTEFLWQEGHTAHETSHQAHQMALTILKLYQTFVEHYLAIPVITGEKCESERFAGASHTYTFEAVMQDGKALQMGTSHVLAHSFPQSFGVTFQDKQGRVTTPHCTSWGISTRLIGALIMAHGDQRGLRLPPRIASVQVVIIPIFSKQSNPDKLLSVTHKLAQDLKQANIKVFIDDDRDKSPGAKFYDWELKGVPIRIELGPRDLEKNCVIVATRTDEKNKSKRSIPLNSVAEKIPDFINQIHDTLYHQAQEQMNNVWHTSDSLAEFGPRLEKENGLYQTGWCMKKSCEERLKKYKATIRCLVNEKKHTYCFGCSEKSKAEIITAKAY